MATIQDVQALGLVVGMAHGSVEVEELALHNATVEASPQAVTRVAGQITKDTLADLANAGKLPVALDDQQAFAVKLLEEAKAMVAGVASEKVEFHQRALANAQEMADVWVVQQFVNDALVFQTYVSTKADGTGWDEGAQAQLDALADPAAFAEREYQALNPEAMQAASTLASLGHACTRPKPGADVFEVDGATTYSGVDLLALAEKRAAEPPPLSAAERVVAALEASASLDDATKKALRGALG